MTVLGPDGLGQDESVTVAVPVTGGGDGAPVVEVEARVAPAQASQVRHPWRATLRTTLWALIGLLMLAPMAYEAATQRDPEAATGWLGVALAVAAGVTRVAALPAVEAWLRRFVPWLAADPDTDGPAGPGV